MPLTYAHLDELEAEAIYVIREAFAQFEHPGILFSGGKDSIVVTHLAAKAFAPAKLPFPLVHIDTGHNFPETLTYRDALVERLGARLVVGSVQESINRGSAQEETGNQANRNRIQTVTLLETIERERFDCLMGGARRDEEKARAKERFFSHRDDFGQWDPKNQRPELWNLFNGKKRPGEHFRVFPISNWTELDVWHYIRREGIELPELYFARPRNVVWRNNAWLPVSEFITLRPRTNRKPVPSASARWETSPSPAALPLRPAPWTTSSAKLSRRAKRSAATARTTNAAKTAWKNANAKATFNR